MAKAKAKAKKVFVCPKCGMDTDTVNGYCEARLKVTIDRNGKVKKWLVDDIDLGRTIDFECEHCGENLTWCIKE